MTTTPDLTSTPTSTVSIVLEDAYTNVVWRPPVVTSSNGRFTATQMHVDLETKNALLAEQSSAPNNGSDGDSVARYRYSVPFVRTVDGELPVKSRVVVQISVIFTEEEHSADELKIALNSAIVAMLQPDAVTGVINDGIYQQLAAPTFGPAAAINSSF